MQQTEFQKNKVFTMVTTRLQPAVQDILYDVDVVDSCSLIFGRVPAAEYGYRLVIERHKHFWEYEFYIQATNSTQSSLATHVKDLSILFEVENESQEAVDEKVVEFLSELAASRTRLSVDITSWISVQLEKENEKGNWEVISKWGWGNSNKLNNAHLVVHQGPLV